MSRHSDKFNALPLEQRQILVPIMNETRIRDLKARRLQIVANHNSLMREIDGLIKRLQATVEAEQEQSSDE